MGAVTPPSVLSRIGGWLRRHWLQLVGSILAIIILLMLGPCGHGCKYGMDKYNAWKKMPAAQQPAPDTINNKLGQLLLGQAKCCQEPEETKVNVPPGCTMEWQDDVINVVCPPCPACDVCEAAPVVPSTPTPIRSCEALARKTHQAWQCLPSNTPHVKARKGLCTGHLVCMIPGSNPPPPSTPTPTRTPQACTNHTITSQVDVVGIYCTGFDYPGTRLNGVPVTGRYHTFSPRKSVVICVPPGGRIGHYNLKAQEGHWAVGTERARISGSHEVADPNFGTAVDGQPSGTGNSRKVGNDWIYRVDEPEPVQTQPGGGTTFDTGE